MRELPGLDPVHIRDVTLRYGMQPSATKFSARAIKTSWWLGTASLAFGLFIKITSELLEREASGVDRTILVGFAKARTPWFTVMAVDLTALGSVTLVVLVSTIALCVLLLLKDRMGALQLVAASVGAGILTTTIKNYIDRPRPPRPEVVTQLIQVSGLSYPSGHSLAAASLYLTVAILVCRHLQKTGHQIAILAMTIGIILLVGISRIYLGVHYPSDVASGISLGAAWALLLAGCFSFFPVPNVTRRGQ
jgi:undecaprenyl-diphosphatase